jgi:hypothetical protein
MRNEVVSVTCDEKFCDAEIFKKKGESEKDFKIRLFDNGWYKSKDGNHLCSGCVEEDR